jgi:molybdopterin molybdotransferase
VTTGTEKHHHKEETGQVALLSVAEAQQRLLSVFDPLEAISLPLAQAVGRVLAGPVRSRIDLPLFANSSMDGFAVQSADVALASAENPVTLAVVTDIPAGEASGVLLKAGEAARIMTGAPLLEGADAVVPVEDTDFSDRQTGTAPPKQVQIFHPARSGDNVRPHGQDVRAGETVLAAGSRLRPQDAGFLAMLGEAEVRVHRAPRVAVFSTGDELLPVGDSLVPGKIYDSNTYTLVSQVEKYGGQPVNLGIVPDRAEAVQESLDRAAQERVDLIASSAGVSVGAFDFVRTVVEQEGHLSFWRVNMRPGKPLVFGDYRGIPFFGLPGNPVSAFVGFEVFVRPALMKMSGLRDWSRPVQPVELQEAVESDGRESYLRCGRSSGRPLACSPYRSSRFRKFTLSGKPMLFNPFWVKSLPAGARVNAWLLDDIL